MKPLPPFTVVVHVKSAEGAVEQTGIALAHGAGGVFLIDHQARYKSLLATYQRVRAAFPQAWLGLNFLDLDAVQAALYTPTDADALWIDSLGAMGGRDLAIGRPWRLFAGASFKYQNETGTDGEQAQRTAAFLRPEDVVTTSGPGTGMEATPEKVRAMKGAVPGCLLALASGVTAENVAAYLPFVDCFLVATGVSKTFHELDPDKVRELSLNFPPVG